MGAGEAGLHAGGAGSKIHRELTDAVGGRGGIAFRIGVVQQNGHGTIGTILGQGTAIVIVGHRRIVHRCHGDHEDGRAAQRWQRGSQVADAVGHRVVAVEVGARRVGDGAIGVGHGRAAVGPIDHGERGEVEPTTVDQVVVVGQHVEGGHRAFRNGHRIVVRHRRVVRRSYREGDHRIIATEGRIAQHIGDGRSAIEVRCGIEGDHTGCTAVGPHALCRGEDDLQAHGNGVEVHGELTGIVGGCARIAFGIGVVEQHVHRAVGAIFREGAPVVVIGDGQVVHRRDREGDQCIITEPLGIAELIRGGRGSVEVGGRIEHHQTDGGVVGPYTLRGGDGGLQARCTQVHIHRELARTVGGRSGVALHIGVVGEDVHDAIGAILSDGPAIVVVGHRRIVHRCHHEGDHGVVAQACGIAQYIRQRRSAIVVGGRVEGDHTGGSVVGPHALRVGHCGLDACGTCVEVHGELARPVGGRGGVAVQIGVVGQHVHRAVRAVLGQSATRIIVGHGSVVHRCHGDHKDGGAAQGGQWRAQVADAVGDRIVAVEVGARRVGDGAIAVGHGRAAVGPLDHGERGEVQRTAISNVVVVGHHAEGGLSILRDGHRIVVGHRRVVHRLHREGDHRIVATEGWVAEHIGDRSGAIEVGGRVEGDHTGRTAVGPYALRGGEDDLQAHRIGIKVHRELPEVVGGCRGVAICIGVVQQHIDGAIGSIFLQGATVIVVGDGHVVHRSNGEGDGGIIAESSGVAQSIGNGCDPVEVGRQVQVDGTVRGVVGPDSLCRGDGGLQARCRQVQVHRELTRTIGGTARVAIGIGVVGQDVHEAVGAVLREGAAVVIVGHGRISHSVHGDHHGAHTAQAIVIAEVVLEDEGAVHVGVRRVGEGPIGVHHHGTIGCCGAAIEQRPGEVRQWIIRIAIVGAEHIAEHRILVHGEGIIAGPGNGQHEDVLTYRSAHRIAVVAARHGTTGLVGGVAARIRVCGRRDPTVRLSSRAGGIEVAHLSAVLVHTRGDVGSHSSSKHNGGRPSRWQVQITEHRLLRSTQVGERCRTGSTASIGDGGAHEGESTGQDIAYTNARGATAGSGIGDHQGVGGVLALGNGHARSGTGGGLGHRQRGQAAAAGALQIGGQRSGNEGVGGTALAVGRAMSDARAVVRPATGPSCNGGAERSAG